LEANNKTIIIAEAGVNHNGSLKLALELIDAASYVGADIVKFQTFSAEDIASEEASMADYQKVNCGKTESQYEMLKRLELPKEYYPKLIEHCNKRKIKFMSSIFDHRDVHFLHALNMPFFKIPSGEITNGPLLLEVAKTKSPIILSTGMATLGEIEQALMVIAFGFLHPTIPPSIEAFTRHWQHPLAHKIIAEKVILLHCTSDYPALLNDVNLRAMSSLAQTFQVSVGYSDHTRGTTISIAAVALGAQVIEKHFTIDQTLPGPDHKASLSPNQFKDMVEKIREVEVALGSPLKFRTSAEENTAQVARKRILASKKIEVGDTLSEDNMAFKRAEQGISPMNYWEKAGKKSTTVYEKNEYII